MPLIGYDTNPDRAEQRQRRGRLRRWASLRRGIRVRSIQLYLHIQGDHFMVL